jgi:predicted transcriptional regulator
VTILDAANKRWRYKDQDNVQGVPFVRAAKGIYLSMLVENELLGYQEGELKYKTTDNGLRFMRTYDEIGEMVSPEA